MANASALTTASAIKAGLGLIALWLCVIQLVVLGVLVNYLVSAAALKALGERIVPSHSAMARLLQRVLALKMASAKSLESARVQDSGMVINVSFHVAGV